MWNSNFFKTFEVCDIKKDGSIVTPWALPLVASIIMPGGLIIPYISSVYYGHVDAWIPTVTNTGFRFPDVLFFSVVLNLASFIYLIDVLCRYFITRRRVESYKHLTTHWMIKMGHFWNTIALMAGLVSICGCVIVANCEPTLSVPVHIIGTILSFIPAPIYSSIYTIIFCYGPRRPRLSLVRIPITVAIIASTLLFYYFVEMQKSVPIVEESHKNAFLFIPRDDQGSGGKYKDGSHPLWYSLILHPVFEWMIVITYGFYNLTFIPEYRDFRFNLPNLECNYIFRSDTHHSKRNQISAVV